jgi:hypothetical protein
MMATAAANSSTWPLPAPLAAAGGEDCAVDPVNARPGSDDLMVSPAIEQGAHCLEQHILRLLNYYLN